MFPVKMHYMPIGTEDKNLVDPKLIQDRQSSETRKSVATKSSKISPGKFVNLFSR